VHAHVEHHEKDAKDQEGAKNDFEAHEFRILRKVARLPAPGKVKIT
jgi:hypothetical protein